MQTNSKYNHAVVWSQTNCSWCRQAKRLLEQRGIPYREELIGVTTTKEEFLKAVPNARTVPQIFLDGELVGGFQELNKVLHSDNTQTVKMV